RELPHPNPPDSISNRSLTQGTSGHPSLSPHSWASIAATGHFWVIGTGGGLRLDCRRSAPDCLSQSKRQWIASRLSASCCTANRPIWGRRIASGHLDLDPAWLRMLRLGDAQGEYTMFDLCGNLGGIKFLGKREHASEAGDSDFDVARFHALRHRDAHLALDCQRIGF